ncbi:MAG: hypothetical protein FJZ16_00285 [Candidatus Omnitrophica bacterium]|nr:hypothetical protein [Candidatus Omnitrophota bacterium]
MKHLYFKEVYIERDIKNLRQTDSILKRLKPKSVNLIRDIRDIRLKGNNLNTTIGLSKKVLFLAKQRGNFIKKFFENKNLINCSEYRIDLISGCIFDCAYCYLQSYLENHIISIYVNLNNFKNEFLRLKRQVNLKKSLFTTGELSDSLALEWLSGYTKFLAEIFSEEDLKLELRTKSSETELFSKNAFNKKNLVVHWTVNPDYLIKYIEYRTPTLRERLSAFRKAQEMGFKTGIRLDPIFHIKDWEEKYRTLINYIYNSIGQECSIDYSLGCFRYTKELKKIIQMRFKNIKILDDEFIKCEDGKFRYFRDYD